MKRWFLYPPGASPPISLERTHHPLGTVSDWFAQVYPKLSHLDQPPINGGLPVPQGSEHEGYRPLECVQVQGDVMYVPATWNHLTVNIGKIRSCNSDSVTTSIGERDWMGWDEVGWNGIG